jgi:hypothetical protein
MLLVGASCGASACGHLELHCRLPGPCGLRESLKPNVRVLLAALFMVCLAPGRAQIDPHRRAARQGASYGDLNNACDPRK